MILDTSAIFLVVKTFLLVWRRGMWYLRDMRKALKDGNFVVLFLHKKKDFMLNKRTILDSLFFEKWVEHYKMEFFSYLIWRILRANKRNLINFPQTSSLRYLLHNSIAVDHQSLILITLLPLFLPSLGGLIVINVHVIKHQTTTILTRRKVDENNNIRDLIPLAIWHKFLHNNNATLSVNHQQQSLREREKKSWQSYEKKYRVKKSEMDRNKRNARVGYFEVILVKILNEE